MRHPGKPFLVDRFISYRFEVYNNDGNYDLYLNDEILITKDNIEDLISKILEMYIKKHADIGKMLIENSNLREQIFDMEQKIKKGNCNV